MDRRRMRDMARRRRDMRDRRRDMRNPYGSAGGYVTSRRTGADRLMMDDMRRYRENPEMYDLADITRQNRPIEHDPYTPYRDERSYNRNYDYAYMDDYNYDYARGRRNYRNRDYASEEYLGDEELMEWSKDLLDDIEPQFKQHFERNRVLQRAKEMGVKFKDYSEDEYYVTALMMATDYGKTIGMNNPDLMFRMAVNWLEDDDAELQGSEKLAVYYDEIICPED